MCTIILLFFASVLIIIIIFITHALPHPAQSFSNWWHIPCKKTFVIKLCVESFGKGERFLFTKLLNELILLSSFLLSWISLNCPFTPTFCKHWAWVANFYQVWPGLLVHKVESKRHCYQCPLHLLFFLDWWWQTTLYRFVYLFVVSGC